MFVSRAYQGVQQDFDQQLLNAPSPTKPTTTPTPDKSTTNDTEEVKTSKTEKWFSTKRNKGFSQGLSFSQE
jgi:hypothetical protein